jgi:hypothetical protein
MVRRRGQTLGHPEVASGFAVASEAANRLKDAGKISTLSLLPPIKRKRKAK